ncbi:unnamed protein product [Rhizoctonia solani]|uniref:Uncharacterized protein n=1 Tax=Rhizoctonia solani TaxID=456999 RepID=A0A8H2XCT3_9AGAM|nr:unnamed protein product [Rhizoctonia solani]
MPPRPRYPDPIAYIYAPHQILPEDTTLDPEDPSMPEYGEVKVRALDGFIFVKDGRFVYPTYGLPKRWWNGVLAFGYMAALTGDFKHFIWAGQWDEDFEGKHIEVVILANLVGLSKERSKHWRKGLEHILWLETEQGYVYALLEPAEQFDRGGWGRVNESWTNLPHPGSRRDASFTPLDREAPRPKWWAKDGNRAWNHWKGVPETTSVRKLGQATGSLELWAVSKNPTDRESTNPGTLTTKAPPTKSKPSPKVGAPDAAIANQPSTSRAKQHEKPLEPFYVESSSSEEETLAPCSPSPLPTTSQANHKQLKGKSLGLCKPPAKPAANVSGGVKGSRGCKRRVVSGASDTHQRQKQKTVELIDLTSDLSDEENPLSNPGSPPHTPSDATEEAISSPTLAADAESLSRRPDGAQAEVAPMPEGQQEIPAADGSESLSTRSKSHSLLANDLGIIHVGR